MSNIDIDGRHIGGDAPVLIIAEAGNNHQGEVNLAKELVDMAKESGADAIKFQKRDVRSMLTDQAYRRPYNSGKSFGDTYGQHREYLELDNAEFEHIFTYAKKRDILFFASAWDMVSADFLESIGVRLFKIGSPDLTNIPLCEHVAKKGLPVLLSTGMSELWEIERTVASLKKYTEQLILLHCVSLYPPQPNELQLRMIQFLSHHFDLPVGYSGHELGYDPVIAAVALGASVIEKHITLDKSLKGGDHSISLDASELRRMVLAVRSLEDALGVHEKSIHDGEAINREKLGKSICSDRDIRKNEIVTREMLTCKSPATGISPLMLEQIIGKRAKRDIRQDMVITSDDISID